MVAFPTIRVDARARLVGSFLASAFLSRTGSDGCVGTDADATLFVAIESVHSREAFTTTTYKVLAGTVNAGVSHQIMSSDESCRAKSAPERSICKMCLYVGLNVVLSPESSHAASI